MYITKIANVIFSHWLLLIRLKHHNKYLYDKIAIKLSVMQFKKTSELTELGSNWFNIKVSFFIRVMIGHWISLKESSSKSSFHKKKALAIKINFRKIKLMISQYIPNKTIKIDLFLRSFLIFFKDSYTFFKRLISFSKLRIVEFQLQV